MTSFNKLQYGDNTKMKSNIEVRCRYITFISLSLYIYIRIFIFYSLQLKSLIEYINKYKFKDINIILKKGV